MLATKSIAGVPSDEVGYGERPLRSHGEWSRSARRSAASSPATCPTRSSRSEPVIAFVVRFFDQQSTQAHEGLDRPGGKSGRRAKAPRRPCIGAELFTTAIRW